jgi:Flp pilus assembly protein TadG
MVALTFIRRLRTRARSEQGAELIEFAMVTPIFALLIAAMFDFGFMFRNWELMTNAAREGARVGVLPAYACDGSTPDVQARVQAYMAASGISDTGLYDVTTSNAAVTTTAGTFNACVVTVQMFSPLPSLGVIGAIFGDSFTSVSLKSQAVMRTETQAAAP